nr:MAG TPA: hypothetical protein [Caudoviricetes sp.]
MHVWHSRCFTGASFDIRTLTRRYTGSLNGDSGEHHDCSIALRLRSYRLFMHFFTLQIRKSPDVSARAFLFFMPPLKVKAAYQSRLKYDAFN